MNGATVSLSEPFSSHARMSQLTVGGAIGLPSRRDSWSMIA